MWAGLGLILGLSPGRAAEDAKTLRWEDNAWPVWVGQWRGGTSSGAAPELESWTAGGPLVFHRGAREGRPEVGGVRPLWIEQRRDGGLARNSWVLHPLLSTRRERDGVEAGSVFELIKWQTVPGDGSGQRADGAGAAPPWRALDVWPFYFSRATGEAPTSYQAWFPLGGTMVNRFGQDRLSWVLFPLYARFEKRGVVTTAAPWPLLRWSEGGGQSGFALWPLYGETLRADGGSERYALWPLVYHREMPVDGNTSERAVNRGFLPFYASDVAPGYRSETWLWPFFGHVDRSAPFQYRANNYLWPLWVQGRGDDRRVNRWAPFYTHSVIKGTEKHWVLWPLWRRQRWPDGAIEQTRTQVLFALYHDTVQRSRTTPSLAPARKRHLWPLFSEWDNGAGRRQVQVLSPLEVFLPHSEEVRQAWSPLFSVYRYERQSDGASRHSLLWDGVTYRSAPGAQEREWHFGPLLGFASRPEAGRFALLRGVLGLKRGPVGSGWRLFVGDFRPVGAPSYSQP
ncbi:MAG: hypothetical protein FJ382_10040 [Verrucomicrobia bacterium]|nr:hypothetical protein [Verrucomicrobiota bacterium]